MIINGTDRIIGDWHDYAFNTSLEQAISIILAQKYPGHPFDVTVSRERGVVLLRLIAFSDIPFVIKLTDIKNSGDWRLIVNAAGELLERFRLARGKLNEAEFLEAQAKFKPFLTRRKAPPN